MNCNLTHEQIPDYEGKYEACSDGYIFSVNANKHMRSTRSNAGYYCIRLYKKGYKTHTVHKLIIWAFAGKFDNKKLSVDHIDGNKCNNAIDNLRLVTYSDNTKNAYKLGLIKMGDEHPAAKLNSEQIEFIQYDGTYNNVQLAKMFSVDPMTISRVKRGLHRKVRA